MKMKKEVLVLVIILVLLPGIILLFNKHRFPVNIHTRGTANYSIDVFNNPDIKTIYVPRSKDEYITERHIDTISSASPAWHQTAPTVYTDRKVHRLPQITRPYDGASFPQNIAPPLFKWDDQVNNLWLLSLSCAGESFANVCSELPFR